MASQVPPRGLRRHRPLQLPRHDPALDVPHRSDRGLSHESKSALGAGIDLLGQESVLILSKIKGVFKFCEPKFA